MSYSDPQPERPRRLLGIRRVTDEERAALAGRRKARRAHAVEVVSRCRAERYR